MDKDGNVSKSFNTHDFYGMQMLHEKHGINVGIFTGCSQPCNKAQIDRGASYAYFYGGFGPYGKERHVKKYLDSIEAEWDDVAFIGDDLNDLEAMEKAGIIACPADATSRILNFVGERDDGFVMTKKGGEGCVRELIDFLVKI